MEGHSFAPVILTYHNVYLVYSAYLFQLITTVFQQVVFSISQIYCKMKSLPSSKEGGEIFSTALFYYCLSK